MLCKVTDDTIKEWVTTYLTNYTGNPTSPKYGYMVNNAEAVLPARKYCFFEGYFSISKDYWVSYDVNTSTTANYIKGTATENTFYRRFEGYIDAGKYFYIGHGYQGTYVYLKNITMRMADYVLFKNSFIKWYVNELKGIGELGTINVFWMLPDGSRNYWPNRHDVTSEIITGNIIPWNYVKFLTIKWADGEIYKIWVYK